MIKRVLLTIVVSLFFATMAVAGGEHKAEGVVENVKGEKVAIKHGPIPTMNMGAMTMSFSVIDPEMLKDLKPGQELKFSFEEKDKALVITGFELK